MPRYIDAYLAQQIADAELSSSDKGTVQWILAHTPTADVQKVKHGKWIIKDITPYCSVCYKSSEYDCDGTHSKPLFCPHCGAKMDGEREEGNDRELNPIKDYPPYLDRPKHAHT